MNRIILTLLVLLCCAVFGLVCEARPSPVHDYIFTLTGVVTAEDATPIKNAEITLEVNGPVYKGVELIKNVKSITDDTGGFVFTYMSYKRGVKYSITVRKEGFEPQTVSGSSPPASHHTIHLKKARGGDASSPNQRSSSRSSGGFASPGTARNVEPLEERAGGRDNKL
jgi:hypothetical protein